MKIILFAALIASIAVGEHAYAQTKAVINAGFQPPSGGGLAIGATVPGATLQQDVAGSRIEFNKTNSPLDFAGTRAGMVMQLTDTQPVGSNMVIPAWEFTYSWSGDGVVKTLPNSSSSVNAGLWVVGTKTGDASAQLFTGTGQLGAVGKGGYNELGGFQAQLTNTGSTNGNISGYEVYVADGTNGRNYPTSIKNIVTRIARFNTSSISTFWQISPEGTRPIDSILSTNTMAIGSVARGFDLTGLKITSGYAMVIPNNGSIAFLDSGGTAKPILLFDTRNNTDLVLGGGSFRLLKDSLASTGFSVDPDGVVRATSYFAGASAGVSCAAGMVNLSTLVVTNGIITHC
jgi:hypothetical protein